MFHSSIVYVLLIIYINYTMFYYRCIEKIKAICELPKFTLPLHTQSLHYDKLVDSVNSLILHRFPLIPFVCNFHDLNLSIWPFFSNWEDPLPFKT